MNTIYRIALNSTKSTIDAEDVTQNVLLKLFQTGTKFENEEHIKNWLIRVTINECKKMFILRGKRNETSLDELSSEMSFSDARQTDVFQAVMALPQKYRIAIYLHYYEGYSIPEISGILKVPASTIQTHLQRGRSLLKKALEEP